jgi:hypothetical protein
MIPRFVVVPAVPKETGSTRSGSHFYCTTAAIGFNLYDNQDKCRLQACYPTLLEAAAECERLNAVDLQSVRAENSVSANHDLRLQLGVPVQE